MCGICGIVNIKGNDVQSDVLARMTDAMSHRGPDDRGLFIKDSAGLGHRRLSIIDLNSGHQPMFNEDKSVATVFNGEIYNYREIRSNLINKGHIFKTNSDTEVIVHAYEEFGLECIDIFRGMFAIAIYDSLKKMLFLARDRLGIKPLYYCLSKGEFLFASEIKPILLSGYYSSSVNVNVLDSFITMGYVPGKFTAFEGIMKLLPGHIGIIQDGVFQEKQYWDINEFGCNEMTIDEAQLKLNDLLNEVLELHLISDVPLGVFLSGGLDSSTVVAYASNQVKEPLKTFSVGYRNAPDKSELGYASLVASKFKTDHFEFILDPEDFFLSLDNFLSYVEEPIVESAGIALLRLSQCARNEAIVLLSGEGADEIFAGYPLYRIMSWIEAVRPVANLLPRQVVSRCIGLFFTDEKRKKYVDWIYQPFDKRYRTISCDVTPSIKDDLYQKDFAANMDSPLAGIFEALYDSVKGATRLQQMLYLDMKTWLPDDLLIKADKMTMAASVELRVPFLDHKLVEFAVSLPDQLKLNIFRGKHILKKVAREVLPKEILSRKKMGFPVPVSAWLRDSIYNETKDILLDSRSLSRGYFNPDYINKILEFNRTGKEDFGRRIFALLVLELWHRKYIDN